MTLIGQNDSLGEEVMIITIRKNCLGEGVMAHNLPLLYGSFKLGGTCIYYSIIISISVFFFIFFHRLRGSLLKIN